MSLRVLCKLLDDVSHNTGTDCTATFADSEVLTLVHSDWGVQGHLEGHLVAWHHHFLVGRELNLTSHVRCAEVELWLVALANGVWRSTLFLLKDVDFRLKLGVWGECAWSDNHLTALDLGALDTAQQQTSVVTCLTLVEALSLKASTPVTTEV